MNGCLYHWATPAWVPEPGIEPELFTVVQFQLHFQLALLAHPLSRAGVHDVLAQQVAEQRLADPLVDDLGAVGLLAGILDGFLQFDDSGE
ncbi:hypothetical protein Aple_097620 [Acrocarpospora pleiomorpha]|uniref:Uncharacterized protein n=1 Tax=Acrocarpospora pleiomorpha TaxID=90975 RepID=A0A5M3Y429_9ACTN|nr:hypothetical protein Aple_097620 [Acrocarpospora pleiomorpha]